MNIRKDTRGLSLVELIVSVTILALIVSPLLHMILVAANTARRSADMGDATLAAQNLLEDIIGTDMKSLSSRGSNTCYTLDASGGRDEGMLLLEDADGYKYYADTYEVYMKNVNPTGTKEYDALLSLDARPDESFNGYGVTIYNPMKVKFAQPYKDEENYDVLAEADLEKEAYRQAERFGEPASLSKVPYSTKREIIIDVYMDKETSSIMVEIRYEYIAKYDLTYYDYTTGELVGGITMEVPEEPKPYSKLIKGATYNENTPDPMRALDNIFFFYFPQYDSGQPDKITINNNNRSKDDDPLFFELYIIKQLPVGADPLTFVEPAPYNVEVSLRQNQRFFGVDESTIPPIFTNIVDEGVPGFYTVFPGSFAPVAKPFREDGLLKIGAVNRIYTATLQLFPAGTLPKGADPSGLTPLATMTATKLTRAP